MTEDPLAEIKARRPPGHMPLGTYDLWHEIDWLVGEVERLRDLLGRLEWAGGIETGPGSGCVECCPACGVEEGDPHGHDPGCWLAAELPRP